MASGPVAVHWKVIRAPNQGDCDQDLSPASLGREGASVLSPGVFLQVRGCRSSCHELMTNSHELMTSVDAARFPCLNDLARVCV